MSTAESSDKPPIHSDEHGDYTLEEIPIRQLRRNEGLQPRDTIDVAYVAEIADAFKEGRDFPPIDTFRDSKGVIRVADGYHRAAGAERAKLTTIMCKVRVGEKRDAKLFACGANASHGKRRSNADKVRALMFVLDDEDYCRWNDAFIAKKCGVSAPMVASYRPRSRQEGARGSTRVVERNGVKKLIDIAPKPARKVSEPVPMPAPVQLAANTHRDPLADLRATLKADDIAYRENVKTDVGMAMIVAGDAVYHAAGTLSIPGFLTAMAAVQLQRAALKLRRAVIFGPFSEDLRPYIDAAKSFKVDFMPTG